MSRRASHRFVGLVLSCIAGTACSALAQNGFYNFETPHVHPMDLTPNGRFLVAVNTADNRLEVFDVLLGSPIPVDSIAVGVDPVSVRARSNSEVWVVNRISDSISVVDLPTGRVVRTIQAGDEPGDVVFAGTPQRAFVTVSQLNQVRVFNPANLGAAPTILNIQGEDPRGLAVSADGSKVYAAIFRSGNASTIVRQQDVSNPAGPYGGLNPPPNFGNTFSPPIAAGGAPRVAQIVRRNGTGQWMDGNNRNWSAFVSWNLHDHDVATIDANTLSATYTNSLMTNVMAIGVRPDGVVSVVGTEAVNQIRFEPNVKGVFIRTMIGSFTPAGATQIADLNPHLSYSAASVAPAMREISIGDPRGIVWHPTSGKAYVTGMGSNSVVVTDDAGSRYAEIDVGQGPTGLVLNASGSRLYVMNKFDGSISTIDTASNSELSRTTFFDPTPNVVKAGRPFLYDTHLTSGLGQASCASCHIDGRTDFLAWDLGNPAGTVKAINQPCRTPGCRPWHPMKGPMVTQSLQGIVGNEPLHWRGDRENVAAFGPAYTDLQGMDAQPSPSQLQQFTDFIQTIKYQPNPNRNLDGTMPGAIPSSDGGTGNPVTGQNLFSTLGVLGPGNGLRCVSCHALPVGAGPLDDPGAPLPQTLKIVQLRGMWTKTGWSKTSQTNNRGFGFNHDSDSDSLIALLNIGFNFGAPNVAPQRRRDVEAFMIAFDTESHAGMGQQVTFDGTNNANPADVARLNTFITLANNNTLGLIAKGRFNNASRGWQYIGSNTLQSDRVGEQINITALRNAAAAGSEITFTLVAKGTERRTGIDRDADGTLDGDEIVVCPCPADFDGSGGTPDSGDIEAFFNAWLIGSASADVNCSDGTPDSSDVSDFFEAWLNGGC
jgi:YVTN family beta-propeller protein